MLSFFGRGWHVLLAMALGLSLSACSSDEGSPDTSSAAQGGGSATSCTPGEVVACFSGSPGQEHVGLCQAGQKVCEEDGSQFGPCDGEVLPAAETCSNPGDEDCDGLVDEEGPDCDCAPGAIQDCYSASPATEGVGRCKKGSQVCNDAGDGWGVCTGEVVPVAETCTTNVDDDCDGQINEGGAGCDCSPNAVVSCYSGPAGTLNVGSCKAGTAKCNASGTGLGPCVGEVYPTVEACSTAVDVDCDGKINETTTGCSCTPATVISCYTGPPGTDGAGLCHGGQQICEPGGNGYGPCGGEVTPIAEDCASPEDEDCDGASDEGCPCSPGETASCYTGPANTENVGPCHAGTTTCLPSGLDFGPCVGEVVPVVEACGSASDDDCDGLVGESIWKETTVDVHTPGGNPALVVDAAGGVHALYHDTFFDLLVYAYKPPGGVFSTTTVDIHAPGSHSELVVDAAGGVHALYYDTFFDSLAYAYKPPGGVFTKVTVDVHTPGDHPALVVDATGGVHVLYHDVFFDHLDYAYKPLGGVFTETTVDVHPPGGAPALVVDAAGGVHALYHDIFFDDLDYAYKPAGGVFAETTVDAHTPAGAPALVVDATGGVHALYHDLFFDDLDYAYKPLGGVFTEDTVDSHEPGGDPKLVVDAAGGVHALYHDAFFDDLDYAYLCP